MPYDRTKDYRVGSNDAAPARRAVAVVPSNTTDLPAYARSLYVGVAGDVSFIPIEAPTDTAVLLKAHPVGYTGIGARRVMATGTTATNIVALV